MIQIQNDPVIDLVKKVQMYYFQGFWVLHCDLRIQVWVYRIVAYNKLLVDEPTRDSFHIYEFPSSNCLYSKLLRKRWAGEYYRSTFFYRRVFLLTFFHILHNLSQNKSNVILLVLPCAILCDIDKINVKIPFARVQWSSSFTIFSS